MATNTKRNVAKLVSDCLVDMNRMDTRVDLNSLPLGSYDILIGMNWMERHKLVLNFLNKTFTCMEETGETRRAKGIPQGVSI